MEGEDPIRGCPLAACADSPISRGLAFVDVETTGLDPAVNRIAEIGVVAVDGDDAFEWTTFLAQQNGAARLPRSGAWDASIPPANVPCFSDIARPLHALLGNRILVAHNARFDYSFLKAEFERVGMEFRADVLCSLALSRRLYPDEVHHDLDTLLDRHSLNQETRHRALPDARLVYQFWRKAREATSAEEFTETIIAMLADPVFPDSLDIGEFTRLPDAPGVYQLFDGAGTLLRTGEASNLRLHLLDHFRLGHASAKALALAQRVTKVRWKVTQGMIDARISHVQLVQAANPRRRIRSQSWQFDPAQFPPLALASLDDATFDGASEHFGAFTSERKAKNVLLRLAQQHRLCHGMLGITAHEASPCAACEGNVPQCTSNVRRLRHLTKLYSAIGPLKLKSWPYPSAIGIRERAKTHIFDDWRYVDSVTQEGDVAEARSAFHGAPFDPGIYDFLRNLLPRLPAHRLIRLKPQCEVPPKEMGPERMNEVWTAHPSLESSSKF